MFNAEREHGGIVQSAGRFAERLREE